MPILESQLREWNRLARGPTDMHGAKAPAFPVLLVTISVSWDTQGQPRPRSTRSSPDTAAQNERRRQSLSLTAGSGSPATFEGLGLESSNRLLPNTP